jgi:cytochrome c556
VQRNQRLVVDAALFVLVSVCVNGCSRQAPTDPRRSPSNSRAAAPHTLIGAPMTPVVSVKELMKYMIDPVSDNIFDAVWWDATKAGVVKHEPKTEADWDRVRTGAVSLAEGIQLLKVPRRWTPPGDVNNSTGANPPELSPAQMQAKLERDPVLWEAKIQALRNAALEIVEVVNKKDVDALFSASEDVDQACEACHLEYWYPGDAAAVREWKNGKARFDRPAPGAPRK